MDVGTKRIGLAKSDPLGLTAQGLATINRTTKQRDFEEILKYVRDEEVNQIIVGIPLNQEGEVGPEAQKILEFIKELKGFLESQGCVIPIETWDERYSTTKAEEHLISFNVSRAKRRKVIDKMAAVMILKDYLESKEP